MTRTRLIVISLILFLLLILSVGVWRQFNNKTVLPTNNLNNLNPYPVVINQFQSLRDSGLSGLSQLGLISSSTNLNTLNNYGLKIAAYDLIESSSTVYWLAAEKTTGYLYLGTDTSLEKTKILNTPFLNIVDLGVLTNGDKVVVLIKNQDPNNQPSIKVINLDLTTGSSSVSELPLNIKDFVISPNHKQVIFSQEIGEKENWLVTDGSLAKFNPIYSTTYQDFFLTWPNQDTILFYTKPSNTTVGQAYLLDLKNNNLTKIATGLSLEATISPSLQSKIYSNLISGKIIATLTNQQYNLAIPTSATKCLINNDSNSLCAVPRYYLTNIDNWYKGRVQTSDDLFIIDQITRKPIKWRELPGLDVVNLKHATSSRTYFFVNKTTSELWSVLAD